MLNVNQVAKMLGISIWSVYRKANKREIPYVKLGYKLMRFDENDINNYINKHKVKAK